MSESVPANAPPPNLSAGALLWQAAARQLSLEGLKRTPPMWLESRMWLELGRLLMHPIARGVGLPRGHGRPVFFIPGYLAGDASLTWMAAALRAAGVSTEMAGVRLNVACSTTMMASC